MWRATRVTHLLSFADSRSPRWSFPSTTAPWRTWWPLARCERRGRATPGQGCAPLCTFSSPTPRNNSRPRRAQPPPPLQGAKPFDAMNSVAASMLLHLTAPSRFPGALNVGLPELASTLVPFPRLKFILSSLAPLHTPADVGARAPPRPSAASSSASSSAAAAAVVPSRTIDALFTDALSREAQLLRCDSRGGTTLAAAFLLRGAVSLTDARRNAARLPGGLRTPAWGGGDGAGCVRLGMCGTPPAGAPAALLALANNTRVGDTLNELHGRFKKLRARRVFLHQCARVFFFVETTFSLTNAQSYTQFMELGEMDAAAERVASVALEYAGRGVD